MEKTKQQPQQDPALISPQQVVASNPTSEEERLAKMDAMMDEMPADSGEIPQRPYVGLSEDPTQQWLDYCERMRKSDEKLAEERAARKKLFEAKDRIAAEKIAKRQAEEAKRPKLPHEIPGTMEWFAAQMASRCSTEFDYNRVNVPQDTLQSYLKIALCKLVEQSGETFKDDAYTNQYIGIVAKWMRTHTKMGLILRGNVGVGKTTIARAISAVYAICNGRGYRIHDAVELTRIARENEAAFREICNYKMICIDDLGTEPAVVKNYGNDINPIIEILTHRHARRLFTIITTNLAVNAEGEDEIYLRYGKRIGDRLDQLCNTIKFDGNQKSYRQHE